MVIKSSHPPITVPTGDLWSFLFQSKVREYPDSHVIYSDSSTQKQYTFEDVRDNAEQFGQGIQQQWQWQKGDVMALFVHNSADVAVVTFGTHWAGGVVCPFNNLYTVGELAAQLRSCEAKALTTHMANIEVAREAALIAGLPLSRVIILGEQDPKSQFRHFSNLQRTSSISTRPVIDPKEDLAFLVYSSGTTGLPKGVMLTHENIIANILQSATVDEGFTSWQTDRTIGFLPMYHIYGIAVLLLGPIYRGITIYIMQRFELGTFCQLIQENKITLAYIVPPVALALAKHPLVDRYNLSSLRMMHSSAAPTSVDIIESIHKRLGVPLKQGYGLSEASPGVSSQTWIGWNSPIGASGQLVPSMSMKFMDNGEEVTQGEEGELWIKGPNLFKGYYNNPKATAESIDLKGWYRTGDVGYADENNNIYITDRVKELIKYNGFQVAPAQLEGLLLGHPAVDDVAVIGVYSAERATELPRAYIVAAKAYTTGDELAKEITGWLHAKVAPYKKLRGGIRFVDTIPKSNAGKLLRRILVEQARAEASQKTPKTKL
ncbi:hypothetical protein LTR84_006687 [Exophiala bonariae]|uniref:4-coumarate-CoA ligase n=1 Tax=Exophiala bonariae TaxID=1690606 RepID=A0AAV9N127_9EURO|nr:hypothetical protein LTR84_006687 [Exophiala bonariae]